MLISSLIDRELGPLSLWHREPNLAGVDGPVRHKAENKTLAGARSHLQMRGLLITGYESKNSNNNEYRYVQK